MADGGTHNFSGFDFRTMVNAATGEVDRRIFSDQQIYELELERIFARCWNFMCHESQIAKPGDFFLSFIGDDSVIATRDKKGNLQVLLNTCRHRGNAVCRAEQGHANSFLCTYHGWTYGLDGKLIGVPGFKDFYHEDLDRSQWGLIAAPKVASYKGFVFASMDPDAPELEDYLGPVGRLGINQMAAHGKIIAVDGVQKNLIGCNWKLAVDNLFDFYHPQISHASATMAGSRGNPKRVNGELKIVSREEQQRLQAISQMNHRVFLGEYGHAQGGSRIREESHEALDADPKADIQDVIQDVNWRYEPEAKALLGELGVKSPGHPNIFPNLWFTGAGTQMCLRLPRGPMQTELWWFTVVEEKMTEEERKAFVFRSNHVFGPAGMLEQEDGENWDQSTRATASTVAKRYPLHFGMNIGRGKVNHSNEGYAYIDTHINEHAQLWTYRSWADYMTATSWDEYRRIRTPTPDAVV